MASAGRLSSGTAGWLSSPNGPIFSQIEKDLEPFPSIDFPEVLKKAEDKWGRPEYSRTYGFCHYQIIDNRVGLPYPGGDLAIPGVPEMLRGICRVHDVPGQGAGLRPP